MAWTPTVPAGGEPITVKADGTLVVPETPIIPFIEGDGTGPDIWAASRRVFDAAVHEAYGGKRRIAWMEVLAGKKAFDFAGDWLPDATLAAIKQYYVAIKGPLETPVGGGIRSLNVALRQQLDLYVCLRPVKWYSGVPSPVTSPHKYDYVIFRENTEDIYAGIEYAALTPEATKLRDFLINEMGVRKIRFPNTSGLGIKPVSEEGSKRLIRAAIQFAIKHRRDSVTLVHKGNIMKYTEGAFRDWGYALAKEEFGAQPLDGGPWMVIETEDGLRVTVKDVIADAMLQQILTRPAEYGVVATLNLNGDYLSDALAACVGGIGIAPGANINYVTGHAIFEATHGTAPKYAGQDKVNPGSVILSGVMMLRHLGWHEAADLIENGLARTIAQQRVTYDFHRLMDGATLLKCSEFATAIIDNLHAPAATHMDSPDILEPVAKVTLRAKPKGTPTAKATVAVAAAKGATRKAAAPRAKAGKGVKVVTAAASSRAGKPAASARAKPHTNGVRKTKPKPMVKSKPAKSARSAAKSARGKPRGGR